MECQSCKELKKRIKELDKQVENLRTSRSVLMDLYETLEKEKNLLEDKLNGRLKKNKNIEKPKNNNPFRIVR